MERQLEKSAARERLTEIIQMVCLMDLDIDDRMEVLRTLFWIKDLLKEG